MTSAAHAERPILLHAVREAVRTSRTARSVLAADAPERRFYLGVEAAAEELLHPELAMARPPAWPSAEPSLFREGYLRMNATLAAARGASEPPLRITIPDPAAVMRAARPRP